MEEGHCELNSSECNRLDKLKSEGNKYEFQRYLDVLKKQGKIVEPYEKLQERFFHSWTRIFERQELIDYINHGHGIK